MLSMSVSKPRLKNVMCLSSVPFEFRMRLLLVLGPDDLPNPCLEEHGAFPVFRSSSACVFCRSCAMMLSNPNLK